MPIFKSMPKQGVTMKCVAVLCSVALLALQGCISVPEINSKMRQIDIAWELENQKLADSHRIRALNLPKEQTMKTLKKVFLELGMPLDGFSPRTGIIQTVSVAPTPLTKNEWEEIRKIENPKMQKIAGSMFYLPKIPDKYFLVIRATVVGNNEVSVVKLDYELRNPEYAAQGIIATRRAPPMAVQLGSMKIWAGVNEELRALGESVRKRTERDPELI